MTAVQDTLDWTPPSLVGHRETWDDGGLICYCPIGRDHTIREARAREAATPRPPDPTPVILAAVHTDPSASHVAARRVLRNAITECAARHQGRVHVAWFRHLLPEWIDPHTVGGAVAGWTKAGYLEAIPDQWEPNGGGSNATKPTQVRRLAHPIPPITR